MKTKEKINKTFKTFKTKEDFLVYYKKELKKVKPEYKTEIKQLTKVLYEIENSGSKFELDIKNDQIISWCGMFHLKLQKIDIWFWRLRMDGKYIKKGG